MKANPAEGAPRVVLLAGRFQVRGSSAYTLRLAEHLPAQGIAVQVACSDGELIDGARRRDLGVREYPHLEMPWYGWLVLRRLRNELRKNPPDLLHVQSRGMLSHGSWLARELQIPMVLTVHDYLGPADRIHLDWKWCRRVIAVSESVRRNFASRVPHAPGKLAVIPGGVDVREVPEARPPLEAGQVPVVGTAGPLEAVKGLPFFLGAAQKVLATGRDVEFLIAGTGPEATNLRRLARQLEIAHKVTFVSYLSEFTESLEAMDIFCLPSLQQGQGTIMLEAMAMGKPVIASRVGGVYGIVHEKETGLLVPPSDSGQLADRILELLGDPGRARAIGEAARQMVRREFGLDRMVSQTAQVYREALAESVAASPVAAGA